MDTLDEKGFVFVEDGNAYRCCLWNGQAWLFKWQDHSRRWVSIRHLSQIDVWTLPRNLTQDQQNLYFAEEAKTITEMLFDPKCIKCGGKIDPRDYEADVLVCQSCTDKRMAEYYDNLP